MTPRPRIHWKLVRADVEALADYLKKNSATTLTGVTTGRSRVFRKSLRLWPFDPLHLHFGLCP